MRYLVQTMALAQSVERRIFGSCGQGLGQERGMDFKGTLVLKGSIGLYIGIAYTGSEQISKIQF